MPLVPGDIVHAWYRLDYQGQEYQLHHNYRVESGNSVAAVLDDLSEVAAVLGAPLTVGSVAETYLACLPQDVTLRNVNVQRIRPARSQYVTTTMNAAGTIANNADTGNVAAAIELFTDFAGRDQISVKHIGPLPGVNAYAGGSIIGPYILLLNDLATALLAPISIPSGTTVLNPVVYHQLAGNADILIGRRIGDTARTMRRRTLRVGI